MHEIGTENPMFRTKHYTPSHELRPFVQSYTYLSGEHLEPTRQHWYILPDNCAHLIFYLFDNDGSITPKWLLIGPRSKHKVINREKRICTFICTFEPAGLKSFTTLPVNQLVDQACDASQIFDRYNCAIFESLFQAAERRDLITFVQQLEQFLLRSLISHQPNQCVKDLIQYLSILENGFDLSSFSNKVGYSERHLRNLMKANLGHSPKMIARIERFTNSLKLTNRNSDWAEIAYDSHYYDQSHMISEYQRMVGLSPQKLFGGQ